MRRRSTDDAYAALETMTQLSEIVRRVSGFLDTAAVTQRSAEELRRLLAPDLISIAVREQEDLLVMRGTSGNKTRDYAKVRVPKGKGIGGKVLMSSEPVTVVDYQHDSTITGDFVDIVKAEGLHGMLALPIIHREQLIAVLYGGIRQPGHVGDRMLGVLYDFCGSIAPVLATAQQAKQAEQLRLQEERQRIAMDLHDSIGQLLFGIGVAIKQARERVPDDAKELWSEMSDIEAQASEAASCLREALRNLRPASSGEGLEAAISSYANAFSRRSGLPVSVLLLGQPRELSTEAEETLMAVVREGLHNVVKHAGASSVILTLYFTDREVGAVIQDDGTGIPDGFQPSLIPGRHNSWGLSSLLQRIQLAGGQLALLGNEDGGLTLRAVIPFESDGSQ